MVTSVYQTVDGKKIFQDIKVANPSGNANAANKSYVDSEMNKIKNQNVNTSNLVKKSGDTMTSALIFPKDNHLLEGNTNKVISYESTREIFLSRKESFPMEDAIDMNNHEIENLPLLIAGHEARNKDYVDNNFLNKITGGSIRGDLDMRGHSIKFLKFDESAESFAARVV